MDVEGKDNHQEYLSRRLVLCEVALALATLRRGGALVLKLFDAFLPLTGDLLFILHRCFRRIALVKPITSRPANSERSRSFPVD